MLQIFNTGKYINICTVYILYNIIPDKENKTLFALVYLCKLSFICHYLCVISTDICMYISSLCVGVCVCVYVHNYVLYAQIFAVKEQLVHILWQGLVSERALLTVNSKQQLLRRSLRLKRALSFLLFIFISFILSLVYFLFIILSKNKGDNVFSLGCKASAIRLKYIWYIVYSSRYSITRVK